jgi:uncharacterized protein
MYSMEVYLFPVGQVLLYPSFSKPFVVFEPHLVQMVEDAIKNNVPIAIGSVYEPRQNCEYKVGEKVNFVEQIVGYGQPLIVERRADGAIVVFIEGRGKAKLGEVLERSKPYIVCAAEKIEESHDIDPENFRHFLVVHKIMVHWMSSHIPDPLSRQQFLNYIKTPEQVVGCYASYLLADIDIQQMILESNDINEKVALIDRIISSRGLVA